MFEQLIRSLDSQGLTSATIAKRLGLSAGDVRAVLTTACVAEVKPVYDPVLDAWRKQRAAQVAAEKRAAKARRTRLEAKRAKLRAKLRSLNV